MSNGNDTKDTTTSSTTLQSVIDDAVVALCSRNDYTEKVKTYVQISWRQYAEFCQHRGYIQYEPTHFEEFLESHRHGDKSWKSSTLERKLGNLKMLDLYFRRGGWERGQMNPPIELPPEFEEFLDKQDTFLIKTNHSDCSRATMRKSVAFIMRYFLTNGIKHLSEIDNAHISAYLLTLNGHAKSTVRGELSHLRMFLIYLQMFGYTEDNLATRVPNYRLGCGHSLVKIWESDEISKILDSVDRSNPKGKRDYAMMFIASELGVRCSDICNLRLTDIDWERCCISFVQSKTRNPNVLPLSEKLGNSIIDYLKVRPKTESEYLFVSLNPPYDRVKAFSSSFQKYVMRSGVKVSREAHYGLHSLRATVATKLLSVNVSPDVIFSFLGHTDRNTLSHYIRLDIENLRACALSFEGGELI